MLPKRTTILAALRAADDRLTEIIESKNKYKCMEIYASDVEEQERCINVIKQVLTTGKPHVEHLKDYPLQKPFYNEWRL